MVSSVSSLPYFSYLDQLQGKQPVAPAPTIPSTPSKNTSENASSLVSSLLGKGSFAPAVLGLLQENETSFDSVSPLFGSKPETNGLAKLYASIYNNNAASELQLAKLENTKLSSSLTSFSLISDAVNASKAYNQALQQNAAQAVAASKARTDAIIS